VEVSAHRDLNLQVRVFFYKVHKLRGLKCVSHTERTATEITKIQANVFKLGNSSTDHLFNLYSLSNQMP
jgi:hypothetical protein